MKHPFVLLLLGLLLFSSVGSAQYCMLPGRTSYTSLQPGIINFKLNTINRISANVEKPLNQPSVVVTTDSTILQRGQTYTVTIRHTRDSVYFPTARNNIRVWLDYNHNFSWEDAGETVISADLQAYGVFTASFTVPSNAPLGTTWLRATAKMSADAGHELPTSCDNPADPLGYHGEMEDYKVTIVAATDVPDVATNAVANIFPNPSQGVLHITFDNISHEHATADVYSLAGSYIGNVLRIASQDQKVYELQLNKLCLSPGVYLLKVASGSKVSYLRCAVQ